LSLIRPFEREDAEEVAALYELVMRSGGSVTPPGLAPYFERMFLDQPWADPEIPSLVHLDPRGRIVGFQGSSVRRALFDDRPIRIGCAGQLVAHPDARRRAVGALLVRAYLAGPQDLTITDGATEEMRRMWTLLGGEMAHLSCIGWTRLFRPWRFVGDRLLRGGRGENRRARVSTPFLSLLDRATVPRAKWFSKPAPPAAIGEPLTPSILLENLDALGDGIRLRVAYEGRFLRWLFEELARVTTRGTPVARLVRDRPDGQVLGWYVYYLLPSGSCDVLQVAGRDSDVDAVLDHLLHDAWSNGAAAVEGRLEPRLVDPLAHRHCVMRYSGGALVHSREPEILGALASGRSLLTRLDGEWWMGHSVLDFKTAT
jgi:hypothetical protein